MKTESKKMSIEDLKKSNAVEILDFENAAKVTGGKNRREAELEAESCACECG